MTQTDYLKLNITQDNDYYDHEKYNENFRALDTKAKETSDEISEINRKIEDADIEGLKGKLDIVPIEEFEEVYGDVNDSEFDIMSEVFAKNGNVMKIEATISALINSAGSKYKLGDVVEVLGYYEAGDGAHHKRKIASDDDGSGVHLANRLWANIVHNGEVNVSWFGVWS